MKHPDDLRWASFCAEIEERIEVMRLESGPPTCSTCGSTADASVLESKWCPSCQQWLSRRCFTRAAGRPDGLEWQCRSCKSERFKVFRRQQAIRALRRTA